EPRIPRPAVHDEAHVDRVTVGVDGVHVAAGARRGLEYVDAGDAGCVDERARGRQTGDPGTHDRDAHRTTCNIVRRVTERALDLAGHEGLLVKPRGARALLVLAHGAGAGMRHPF